MASHRARVNAGARPNVVAVPHPMIVPIRVINEAGVSDQEVQTYLDRMNELAAPLGRTESRSCSMAVVSTAGINEDFIAGPPQMEHDGSMQPGNRREIEQVRQARAGVDHHGIVAIIVPAIEQVDETGARVPTDQQSSEGIALQGHQARRTRWSSASTTRGRRSAPPATSLRRRWATRWRNEVAHPEQPEITSPPREI